MEWAQGPRGWGLSPCPWHMPRLGQHVDVSVELSCILSHLLWCGIAPWVQWLQRGSPGTQQWLQQQSHTGGQEQQGEAAACSSHLGSKQRGGGGRRACAADFPMPRKQGPSTQPLSPSSISPSLGQEGREKGHSELTAPPPRHCLGGMESPSCEQPSSQVLTS